MSTQNNIEYLIDQIQLGKISADEANVEMVRMERVKVIKNSIPNQTRKSLNDAVKSGKLSHMKKDGKKPEVYYHPDFKHLANKARNDIEQEILKSIFKITV